jgi:adenosine deaminase
VCVTLNTDNRLVSDTTLTREYQRAYEEAGLSLAQIEQVALNGFKNAFLPHRAKMELLTRVEAALAR